VWNGNNFKGKEAVLKFFEDLPTSEHKIDSLDVQPIPGTTIVFFTIVILSLIIDKKDKSVHAFKQSLYVYILSICS